MKKIDLYFDPSYAKIYEKSEGKSETFFFECTHGKIQNTFILRQIKWKIDGKTYYDAVTPYGYGGPIILECNDIDGLIDEYKAAFSKYCIENNIVCEFIRFHLFDNVDFREKYYGNAFCVLDNVIVDTTVPYEDIWMQYEHKVRKNVKKAQSNGLSVIIENGTAHLDDFLAIYKSTMDRNNAQDYYYFPKEYFEDIAKYLPENYVYFHVEYEGKIIATELVLCSDNYAYSFLGGTFDDYYSLRPNDLLKDAVIKWCSETGRSKFILGGGYQKEDGIYRYKRSFTKADDVPFYIGSGIFDKAAYDYFVECRAKEDSEFDKESRFFPLYRA